MSDHSTLVLTNARTAIDPARRPEAIAVRNGLIVWRGDCSDALADARTIDLAGRWVLPGLTDSHSHLLAAAQQGLQPTVADGCSTVDSFLAVLATEEAALAVGEWLVATSELLPENLSEGRLPSRSELDRLAPHRPVVVRCLGGHVGLANSAALDAAASALTEVPPDELAAGRLTEQSADALFKACPAPAAERLGAALVDEAHKYLRLGVTSVVEAAVGFTNGFDEEWSVWQRLRTAVSPYPLRMAFMLRLDPAEAVERDLKPGPIDADWQIRTLKFFADGIVGARTAAFHHDYLDCPGHTGDTVYDDAELARLFAGAHQAGWQIAVHAIGDRAIEDVLAAYTHCQGTDRRHRIEHLGLASDQQIQTVRDLGIHVATQHGFLPIMGDMFQSALGPERAHRMFATRSLRNAGIPIAGSSDYPIGPQSPHVGLAGAVLRTTGRGTVIGADETISSAQALDSYIRGGAEITHQENIRGSLAPGQLGDLAVFDEHPALGEMSTLHDLTATATIVRGEVMHSRL